MTSRPFPVYDPAMDWLGRSTPEDDARAEAWRDWFASREPLAIASLVLGVFSLIEFGALIVFGVAGIALGIIALRKLRRRADDAALARPHGHRLAWAGIVTSALSLVIAACLYGWRG